MNNILKNKAFTLVELIVVITILSVLATVAFISFQGYSASSRDSVRLADMKSIEKVNTIFKETKGKYPIPNEATNIVFSGATAWTQGVFGKNSYSDTVSMGSVPTDPLTFLPYPYSITRNGQEYQIAAVLENSVSSTISPAVYAGDQLAKIYVKGDYNGHFLKVQTGSLDYLLGVPSILTSDINSVDIIDIIENQRLVYKGYNNLPASYSGSIYNNNGGFAFEANKVILFTGDINDLVNSAEERLDFLDNLEQNYLNTEIASENKIAEILEIKSGSPSAADNYIANILNNNIGTEIKYSQIDPSSNDNPAVLSASGSYVTELFSNNHGYVGLKIDNSARSWGNEIYGGISPLGLLTDIKNIYGGNKTFVALKNDGSVVAWGDDVFQGDSDGIITGISNIDSITNIERYGMKTDNYILHASNGENILIGSAKDLDGFSSIESDLINVKSYYINGTAVAALKDDGRVVTWGNTTVGGNSSSISGLLTNVRELHHTVYGFLAVKNDNTGIVWGRNFVNGTDEVNQQLNNIDSVVSGISNRYFAVKKSDNSVIIFEGPTVSANMENITILYGDTINIYGLNTNGEILGFGPTAESSNKAPIGTGFTDIYYSKTRSFTAFAGLKDDGTVVNWGNFNYGGDPSNLPIGLNNVSKLYNSGDAIVALKNDGTIAYWGGIRYTGDIPVSMESELYNIVDIYLPPVNSLSTKKMIAIRSDGNVFAWGSYSIGGDSTGLNLTNVKQVIGNAYSTAILKNDGEIIAWGQENMGGDIPSLTLEEFRELINNQ